MIDSNNTLTYVNSEHLIIEIEPETISRAWENSQINSTPWAKNNAYLNHVCVNAFLSWLKEEKDYISWLKDIPESKIKVWSHNYAIASFSELVSGIAIEVDDIRLVLLPTETLDFETMYISQEWIKIPQWTADYYLGIYLDLEAGFIEVWGYSSHYQIMTEGVYESDERHYAVSSKLITRDLNVLWLSRQYCREYVTRSPLSSIPQLSLERANSLIDRLSNTEIIEPRLIIPFEAWAGLLAHGGWRQELSDRRQGLFNQWSVKHWLQSHISQTAQQIGWEVTQMSAATVTMGEVAKSSKSLSRRLVIDDCNYQLKIFSVSQPEDNKWRIELRHGELGRTIPSGIKLILRTADLQLFPGSVEEATIATENLFIEVELEPGEGLVWETYPLPDNYFQEILYF